MLENIGSMWSESDAASSIGSVQRVQQTLLITASFRNFANIAATSSPTFSVKFS